MPSIKQIQALFVRGWLLLHFLLVVWRVALSWNERYWLLAVAICPFLLEGLYIVIKRDGVEWKMFSLCFFFYLGATLPGIWLLEIHKTRTFQSKNYTQVEDLVVGGFTIPVRLDPDTWVLVVEEMMLYLMILGRWMLPRGEVGREQLTQLLFGFIGIASDIMELFSLFDEDSQIRQNTIFTYIILGMWSLSVLQFTLTFATSHRARRARGLRTSTGATGDPDHRLSVLKVELLATVLSLFMQDGPFLGIRLYAMIKYNIITYGLVFFTAKNVLVILLLVYKFFLLCSKICCPKKRDDDEEKIDKHEQLDDYPEAYGSDRIPFRKNHNRGTKDIGSGQLRKRKEASPDESKVEHGVEGVSDLQSVIEGPATPAKRMEKWYDNFMVADETAEGQGGKKGADPNQGTGTRNTETKNASPKSPEPTGMAAKADTVPDKRGEPESPAEFSPKPEDRPGVVDTPVSPPEKTTTPQPSDNTPAAVACVPSGPQDAVAKDDKDLKGSPQSPTDNDIGSTDPGRQADTGREQKYARPGAQKPKRHVSIINFRL